MHQFAKGDLASVWFPGAKLHGYECAVIAGPARKAARNSFGEIIWGEFYTVAIGATRFEVSPDKLRPLQKKILHREIDQRIPWSSCIWRPPGLQAGVS